MHPATTRENLYMFTCTCAWSGWYWAVPCKKDDGDTAAEILGDRVILDIAGVPVILGSDRALAFVEGVIKKLSDRLSMSQVLGSAFHPQAQGAVERPHRIFNTL